VDESLPRQYLHPKSPEERQAALKEALAVDPGVSPWSIRAWYFYFVVLIVFCCSGDNGYDATVMSGINSMTQYQYVNALLFLKRSLIYSTF